VHLRAFEGHITDVTLEGDYKDHFGLISEMADKIKVGGIANTEKIERYLLLIDDLPGITARSVVRPSDQLGGSELVIMIEQDFFEGSVGLDNAGSRFLGRTRGEAVVAANSLFDSHDRTTLLTVNTLFEGQTKELRFADIEQEIQLGSEGLRLEGYASVTSTEPGFSLEPLDVNGNSNFYELSAYYPYLRSRDMNLSILGGFNGTNTRNKVLGVRTSNDRVRTLWLEGQFDFLDALAGINQFEGRLTKGLDIFNATSDGQGRTRIDGDHEFWRVNAQARRVQDLPGEFSLALSTEGQYASDSLLSSEEFTLGGTVYGRGFDFGELAGDHGLAGEIELRYGGPVYDEDINEYLRSYQLYTYYDIGAVWQEDTVVGEEKRESLASAGVGVRFNLIYDLAGYMEVDVPLTRDIAAEGDDDPRFIFNVLKRF
jgi:hemolysin activation/secretion protein